jgi:hypothetical protein
MQSLLNRVANTRKAPRSRRPDAELFRARLNVETLEERLVPTIVYTPKFGSETLVAGSQNIGMKSPPVYLVFWGSYWGTTAGKADVTRLTAASKSILGSTYLSGLTQYGSDGKATLGGSVVVTTPAVTNPNKSDLQSFLQQNIDGVRLPRPTTIFNVPIYVVITDPAHSTTNGGYNVPGVYSNRLSYPRPIQTPMHMVYLGTSTSGSSVDLDSFTLAFGHEIAETITDPDGVHGIHLAPPASEPTAIVGTNSAGQRWSSGQVADFEPEPGGQRHYGYRLNGYLVQPYWSVKDAAFIVPDGNSEKFYLDAIWNGSSFTGQYNLRVTGDQLGVNYKDQIAIQTNATTKGVQATMNGQSATFDQGQIKTVNVNALGGQNTVNVYSLPAGVTLNVDNGSTASQDQVNVGLNGSLSGIAGTVNVANTSGQTSLKIDDSADGARNIKVTDHSVGFSGLGTINYTAAHKGSDGVVRGVTSLYVYDGKGHNNVEVDSVGPLTTTCLEADTQDTVTGPAANQVFVNRQHT